MEPTRTALLVRISDDREAEEKGVARQERDCRKHAALLGWGVGEVIVENDTSAFKRRNVVLPDGTKALRVVRPGFRRVLDLLATGGADGFIAYDLDRTCRDPRDLEDLIDVVEARHIPVSSFTGSLRLANDADVTMARVMVAIANKSSRDTSRRVKRAQEDLAEAGKPAGGGRRAYGYERDGMTVRETEAEVIRQMAERVISKHTIDCPKDCTEHAWTLYRIADDLNARGIKPSYANRFAGRTISTILRGPRIAGLRQFRGEIIGPAAWPGIIDRATWDQLQQLLGAPGTGTSTTLIRWLTGSLKCSMCGYAMVGWSSGESAIYWCASADPHQGCGRISVKAARAEAEIERQLLIYLARPDVLASLRGTYSSEAVDGVRTELAEDEQQLKELASMWAQKQISFAEYGEARRIIAARIEESRALVSSTLPATVRQLLAGDVVKDWGRLMPEQRREVAKAASLGWWVMPTAPGFRVWRPDRLQPIKPGETVPPAA